MALRRYFGKISPLLIGNLVGHNGELVIDEVDNSVYIMDGENPGGFKIFDGHSLQQDLSKYNGNIIPAIDNTYTIGNATNHWTSLYVNDIHSGGNLFIDEFINPTATNNSWGNLRVNASRINADRVYAQTNITTDGYLNANIISANGFVEINASNFSGYTFSGLGIGTTGLIHANVGSVPTIYLATDGNPSFTSYANGYNTVGGYTQFYSNVYVTGDNITIPNNTTIGLLPNFTPLNAKITYVDNVNNYTQVLAQNKNSGSSASGDIVVTADNGSDTTHYIDMGINSSTFAGGGGLDGPGDGYLLVEGGKLVIGTINQPNDIVFAIGGDTPSNEVGRFKYANGFVVNGNVTLNQNVNFGGYQQIYTSSPATQNAITITANIANDINGFSVIEGASAYAQVYTDGEIELYTNTSGDAKLWNFGQTGILSLPYSNYIQTDSIDLKLGTQGAASIHANAASGMPNYTWTFGTDGNLTTPGSIIPSANVSYNLGDINHQWKDLYVSNGSIYMGGVPVRLQNGNLVVNGNVVGGGFGSTNQALNTTSNPTFNNLSATGNVTIQGNLIVNGNTTTVSTQNLIINDNIIYVANGNPGSSLDIGFAGHFTAGTYQHTGLVRQASSNVWKLFSNVVAEPGNTIDFTNAIYDGLQTGALISPTITDIYNNLSSLTSNASTQASNLAILTTNAATQASNLATITTNLAGIVGGTTTLANVITSGGVFWSNGVAYSSGSSTYGNTQVSAYYVANTVATSNVQVLLNGNLRFSGGASISDTYGAGYLLLNPNTAANALAGVIIGGSGYLLSSNGARNAVLNYNSTNALFGIYQLSVYGSQQNAIQNGGSNNYGNIGSISSFFGNAFVANVYSPNYFYPNGTSILTGIGGTYSNSNVAAYLPTATSITANLGNVITTGGVFWANGVAYSSGGGTYGNTQVAAYLPTYTGNLSAGNITITSNANAANFNATTQVSTPKVQFTVGGAQIIEDNPLDLAIIGKYQISIKANGTQQYTFGNDGSLTGPGGTFVWANGAIGGNVIATGVYWSNGVAYSSGGGTYSNSNVAAYLPTATSITANLGNVITNSGVYYANGVSILAGISGTYSNTNVGQYLPTYSGNLNAVFFTGNASAATLTSAANGVGYMGMPQNSQSGSTYAVAIGDAGKHLYFTSATVTATIPANSATAFPIGTTIAFVASSATTLTIAITTDTMYLAGTGTTGSRTLAAYGMATAVKVAATTWFISGIGLT